MLTSGGHASALEVRGMCLPADCHRMHLARFGCRYCPCGTAKDSNTSTVTNAQVPRVTQPSGTQPSQLRSRRLLASLDTAAQQTPLWQGAAVISRLVVQAAGRITVMAGGGVRPGNAAALLQRTGVRELHTSARR